MSMSKVEKKKKKVWSILKEVHLWPASPSIGRSPSSLIGSWYRSL